MKTIVNDFDIIISGAGAAGLSLAAELVILCRGYR